MTAKPAPFPGAVHPAITEAMIRDLVQTFYARAREDEALGPIFATVADWDHHVAKITAFWSDIMLRTGRYDGRPLRPHLLLELEPRHFDRWLAIFEATAREVCPGEVADAFILRARRIADSFEMAIGTQNGEVRVPRHASRPLERAA